MVMDAHSKCRCTPKIRKLCGLSVNCVNTSGKLKQLPTQRFGEPPPTPEKMCVFKVHLREWSFESVCVWESMCKCVRERTCVSVWESLRCTALYFSPNLKPGCSELWLVSLDPGCSKLWLVQPPRRREETLPHTSLVTRQAIEMKVVSYSYPYRSKKNDVEIAAV